MTDGRSDEERELWLALERVTGADATSPATASEQEEAGVRAYVETLGHLPHALEPAIPRPETKARILAEIGLRGAGLEEPVTRATKTTATVPRGLGRDVDEVTLAGPALGDAADVSLRHRVAAPGPSSLGGDPWPELAAEGPRDATRESFEVAPASPAPLPAPSSRWLLPLAAMLALSLLGIGYLAGQLSDRNATVARLESRLQGLPLADLATLEEDLGTMKRRFNMVAAIARRAYPLKVVESPDPDTPLDGVVYVCGDHQRWYLNVQGLKPPPPGQEYHLWFLTDRGAINGGVIEVRPDATSEKDAPSMPEGTHAFAITLETAGPHREPEGMMVLLGEESVSL